MRFVIRGRFKPYVRMTRRGKWVSKQAQEYLRSQGDIRDQLFVQMNQKGYQEIPERTPFRVTISIEMGGRLHRQDLDNQVKALVDAAQGVVFSSDLWMDEVAAARGLVRVI